MLTSSLLPGPDQEFAGQMLERNGGLYGKVRAAGGTRYPIGSLDFTHDDGVAQYGAVWARFRALEQRYDLDKRPPGPGISLKIQA